MSSPSQLVWLAHGSPAVPACAPVDGRCWLCGGAVQRGQLVDKWLSDGFTSFDRVKFPGSPVVCEACCYVTSRVSPVFGRPAKDGKKFGGNFRNYTTLWECDWSTPVFGDDGASTIGYCNASKGQKPLIRAFIERRHTAPWFASIAESGQKHLIPFAPMNGPGRAGLVLFEEQTVVVPDDVRAIARAAELLTAGATKDELLSGDYSPRAWQLCTPLLRAFEQEFASERGGPWFALAVWLAQRDEETVSARIEAEKAERAAKKETKRVNGRAKGKVEDSNGRVPPRRKGRVPADAGSERAEALGAAGKPSSGVSPHERDAGGVVHPAAASTPDPKPTQLGLFGADGSGAHGDGTQGGERVARSRRA